MVEESGPSNTDSLLCVENLCVACVQDTMCIESIFAGVKCVPEKQVGIL